MAVAQPPALHHLARLRLRAPLAQQIPLTRNPSPTQTPANARPFRASGPLAWVVKGAVGDQW